MEDRRVGDGDAGCDSTSSNVTNKSLKNEYEISDLKEAKRSGSWYKLILSGSDQISPRLGHSLISAEENSSFGGSGRVTLIGGGNHEGAVAEVWELQLSSPVDKAGDATATLIKLPPVEGLSPKYEFLCAKIESKVWMFGGADAQLTFNNVGYMENGMWVETLTNSAMATNTPSKRTQGGNSATVVLDGKSYLGVFSGGQAGVDAVDDESLYLYDIEEQIWITVPVNGDIPPNRQGHVLTAFRSNIFIHGGLNGSSLHDTLHMIDVMGAVQDPQKLCSWVPVDTIESPPGRAAHGIAQDNANEKFYIFGGLGQSGCLNDLWQFNVATKSWENLTVENRRSPIKMVKPSPRFGVAMAFICAKSETNVPDQYLLVHGGMNSEGEIFNELWVYKLYLN